MPDDKKYHRLMLVTDRHSSFCWDFYMKDETGETIILALDYLLDLFEYQYGFQPKVIETDGEIFTVKPAVRKFIEGKKIRVEPSPPDTQDQNGGAERSGGVIKEKIKAMRGKLLTMLWREVVQAAVYLYNRTPRYNNKWKSPYEALFKRKPAQEHLRVYGCKAFAMMTIAKRK